MTALAIRVSYIGECGWELHVDPGEQLALFDALWETGQNYGIGLYGAFAMNAMRLEKGYRGWGTEYTTERTPLEAGVGMFVQTDNRNFIGREALLARNNDQAWSMALLEMKDTGEDPYYMHTVFSSNTPIGIITSGGYGHRVGKPLALAYFCSDPAGQSLEAEILGRRVAASILGEIPYDPRNERMRSG